MEIRNSLGACLKTVLLVMIGLAIVFGFVCAGGGGEAALYGMLGGLMIGGIIGVFYLLILLLAYRRKK